MQRVVADFASPGLMTRPGMLLNGRVGKLRVVAAKSVPIPEEDGDNKPGMDNAPSHSLSPFCSVDLFSFSA
jgi:hypothetical protein